MKPGGQEMGTHPDTGLYFIEIQSVTTTQDAGEVGIGNVWRGVGDVKLRFVSKICDIG